MATPQELLNIAAEYVQAQDLIILNGGPEGSPYDLDEIARRFGAALDEYIAERR